MPGFSVGKDESDSKSAWPGGLNIDGNDWLNFSSFCKVDAGQYLSQVRPSSLVKLRVVS